MVLNISIEEASKRWFQKAFKPRLKSMIYPPEDISTKTKIADVLDALADGRWHTKEEVQEKAKLEPGRLETVIKFLEDYGFIIVDAARGMVKLNEGFRRLLLQEASP